MHENDDVIRRLDELARDDLGSLVPVVHEPVHRTPDTLEEALSVIADLHAALERRGMVSEAVGITMERYSLTAEVAFSILRRLSAGDDARVHSIATVVVQRAQESAASGRT